MIRHLFSLMWNRKRRNALVALEIFVSFLVLFVVALLGVTYANNWRQPIGFAVDRVWRINVIRTGPPRGLDATRATFDRLVTALKQLPHVEAAAAATTAPYVNSNWGTGDELLSGVSVEYAVNAVTDDFARALSMRVVHGRWFSREDDAASVRPVVVSRRLARAMFGREDVAGEMIRVKHTPDERPDNPREDKRIVGVFDEFRKDGELSPPENFLMHRLRLDSGRMALPPGAPQLPNVLVVRVAPGTTAEFEEALVKRLQAVSDGWLFDVRPLTELRHEMLQAYAAPLVAVGTVGVFLLLMVALGLTGVVWQSVTQRTREFGLRRAKGATIANIRRQVIGELAVLSSCALVGAVILVAQLPFLPWDPGELWVSLGGVGIRGRGPGPGVFAVSIALSAATIYVLTLLCGWYPSLLATRTQPAEALHYE